MSNLSTSNKTSSSLCCEVWHRVRHLFVELRVNIVETHYYLKAIRKTKSTRIMIDSFFLCPCLKIYMLLERELHEKLGNHLTSWIYYESELDRPRRTL